MLNFRPAAVVLLLLLSFPVLSQERSGWSYFWEDIKGTGMVMWKGARYQFTQKENLYVLPFAIAGNSWAFDNDDRIQKLYRTKKLPTIVDNIGDFGVFLNFPFAVTGLWYWGYSKKDRKVQRFAMEWAATMYLTLAESGLLSYIQVHERPENGDLSMWESAFRGDSSYPSGHIVPYAALMTTTFHNLDWYWSLIPLGLTAAASYQRVQDQKHWVSDIVGTFFYTIFASYGVRAALVEEEGVKDLNAMMQFMRKHQLQVGLLRYGEAIGPRVRFSF